MVALREEIQTKIVLKVAPYYNEIWVGECGMKKLEDFIKLDEFKTPVILRDDIYKMEAYLIKKIQVNGHSCNWRVGTINLEDANV